MSTLVADPLTQVAFSIYEGKGVFALLLGSGLSRAAEIPTGWEITLDLIRRVGLAEGAPDQQDWAKWYREKTGKEPDYSTLLEELAASPAERRSILHSYIEPTEEQRADGQRVPTDAHRAIADLVGGGYIRVIVTTNFDRLMENALREKGIEPTVVASLDALEGAEPITHSTCYILKLHGDYKDARILNTEAELGGYPVVYDGLLDRIFDDHGLIVCGWSGEWDAALRGAFLRAPNRRYPVFWASRGELGSGAKEIVQHRKARTITISDADTFFSSLKQRVETLEHTHRQNPLSIDLLVSGTKRYLARPEDRIQLYESFTEETERVLAQVDGVGRTAYGLLDAAEFRNRVRKYESATEPLAIMAGVLGRWGDDQDFPLILDVLQALNAPAERFQNGVIAYSNLRSYPAVLVFTAYGIGLTRAERWKALHSLFDAMIERNDRAPRRAVEHFFLGRWDGDDDKHWQMLEGLDRQKEPLRVHLLGLFSKWAKQFAGLTPHFELLFDRFNLLGDVKLYSDRGKDELSTYLARRKQQNPSLIADIDRQYYDGDAEKLAAEMMSVSRIKALAEAGFAQGDLDFMRILGEYFLLKARERRW